MREDFSVDASRDAAAATITCSGELDMATAPEVEDVLQDLLVDPPATIYLDWTGLTFMDSTGIRLLIRILGECKNKGVDVLWKLSPIAQRALDTVGIHDALLRQYAETPDEPEP